MSAINKFAAIFVFLTLFPVSQLLAAEEPVSDVRVLIDVSGSMKKNDPENLRAPALRMLAGLMPEQSKSGVWTFAKFVNMLVPWREVDASWRNQAEKQSKQIHSYGLFTNIEQVLTKATANAKKPDPKFRRSLILLSDGFVDIEPNAAASKASRQRIIDKLIPKLKQANITVHTIALSKSADHELLKALSFATDGWYQRADNSDDLQRIFLHMFEKATHRDTLPLKDNQFSVDDSVKEMTVLAFRKTGADSVRLILPDGTIYTPAQTSDSLRWLHEQSFDLITIKQPKAGSWLIDADLDPDNRVMVVTDMQLKTTDLPNNVLVGEKFDFEAQLTEKGKAITRDDFLNLVDASLQQQQDDKPAQYIGLERAPKDPVFRTTISDLHAGQNDLVMTMQSATFERERRQTINVVAMPFSIEQQQLEGEVRSHQIQVHANTNLIKPESVAITALLKSEDGSEWPYELAKTADNTWQLTLTDLAKQQDYSLSLQIRAETQKGRSVFLQPEALTLEEILPKAESNITSAMPETEANIQAETEPEQAQTQQPTDNGDDTLMELGEDDLLTDDDMLTDEPTQMSSTTSLLLGNGIILLLLTAGVIWWRRQSKSLVQAGDLL